MSTASARASLTTERDRTLARLASLRRDFDSVVAASRDTNADDEHDPEGTTIAFERSQVDALIHQAIAHLSEVDAAIARLDDASYGTCQVCGGTIPPARLEVRPMARTCVGCA